MVLVLTEDDIRPLVSMREAVAALDAAFAQWSGTGALNLPRRRMPIQDTSAHVMAGILPGGDIYGVRTTAPRITNWLTLFSAEAKAPIALMACGPISDLRTGAASGVTTRHLARADARRVGIIGTGRTARQQLAAICAVRDVAQISAYGRDEARRRAFAKEMTEGLGVLVAPASSAEEAVDGADILVTATNAAEPVLRGAMLGPGVHVNAMGANARTRREIDEEAVLKADIVVIDHKDQGRIEAEPLASMAEAGRIAWDDVAELGEIVQGTRPGRTRDDQITLFNSLGLGFEDVVFGHAVYLRAKAAGIGREVAL